MDNTEYIIVGGGYAGLFFAHQLIKNNIPFILYHNLQKSGSHISAGVCNPVILKRFNTFWKSKEQMEYLKVIFSEIEKYTQKKYLIDEPVVRIFHNENEKKQWLSNSVKENLKPYLNNDFINLESVQNPFGSGIVDQSCRIDVENFFHDFLNYLDNNSYLRKEDFDYNEIDIKHSKYKTVSFKKIIFCEGVFVKNNPFFNDLPIQPNKGHCLEVDLSQAVDPYILKKKHFLFSLDKNKYYYGGTYDRFDQTDEINDISVAELKNGLEEIYNNPYQITGIKKGFRATVADRKPVLGTHPDFENFYIFNGLGARGVLNGSYFSKDMFNYIENGSPLELEIDASRFYKST